MLPPTVFMPVVPAMPVVSIGACRGRRKRAVVDRVAAAEILETYRARIARERLHSKQARLCVASIAATPYEADATSNLTDNELYGRSYSCVPLKKSERSLPITYARRPGGAR
jgi:hypothetical protein